MNKGVVLPGLPWLWLRGRLVGWERVASRMNPQWMLPAVLRMEDQSFELWVKSIRIIGRRLTAAESPRERWEGNQWIFVVCVHVQYTTCTNIHHSTYRMSWVVNMPIHLESSR